MKAKRVPCLDFIGAFAGLRVNHPAEGLCRNSILANCTLIAAKAQKKQREVRPLFAHLMSCFRMLLAAENGYHGIIFFNPFFFLLLDSFLLSFLSPWLPVCDVPWAAAAPPSSFAVPSAVPSVFWAVSLAPAAAEPLAGSFAAGGVAGSGFCASGFASVPSAGGVTLSAPLVVSAGPPGETVATIPVPAPLIRD